METLPGFSYETSYSFCRISPDSLALGAFAPCRGRIADLCAGAGLVGFLLCARSASVRIDALEIHPGACREAQRNAQRNHLLDRYSVWETDISAVRERLPSGAFDGAVANPPYYSADGKRSADAARADARQDTHCSPDMLCQAASWLVRAGGSFSLVYPVSRLSELFLALHQNGLEPKRMRFLRHSIRHVPKLVLLEAKRCGGPGLTLENDFVLYRQDGTETEEFRRLCGR